MNAPHKIAVPKARAESALGIRTICVILLLGAIIISSCGLIGTISNVNAAPLVSGYKIACVGDSLTNHERESHLGHSWPWYLQPFLDDDYTVSNNAVGGDTADLAISRVPYILDNYEPDAVIIMIGHNDIYGDYDSAATVQSQLTTLIGLYVSDGCEVVVSTILPSSGSETYNTTRNTVNTWIMGGGAWTPINMSLYFSYPLSSWSDDNIHLDEQASIRFAQKIAELVFDVSFEVWDQSSGNLASTNANWEDASAPIDGANVIFNETSTASVTWDLTITTAAFVLGKGYTGTVTQSNALVCGGFFQADASTFLQGADVTTANGTSILAGTLTGSTSYQWRCGNDFIQTGGAVTGNKLVANMTGTAKILSPFATGGGGSRVLFHEIHAVGSTTITETCDAYDTLIVDSGKILTISSGKTLTHIGYLTPISNSGIITGTGTLAETYALDGTVTMGTVWCPVRLYLNDGSGASRIASLGANTVFSSNLLVDSAHASYTLTLSGLTYSLEVGGTLIIGTRGVVSTGSATWQCHNLVETAASSQLILNGALVIGSGPDINSGNFDTSNGTFTPGANAVYEYAPSGTSPYVKLKSGQQFETLDLYGLGTARLIQPSGRIANHLNINIGSIASLSQNSYIMETLLLTGALVQNGYRLNVTGAETDYNFNGSFDGELFLNGTASSINLDLSTSMGYLISNKTTNLTLTSSSITLSFSPLADQYVNISAIYLSSESSWIIGSTNETSFTINGLDSTISYRVYQDGEVIATGGGPSFSFTAIGNGEFQVDIWGEKTVSTMVVLAVDMVGIGILVSLIGSFVVPYAQRIKKGQMIHINILMNDLVHTIIFVIIGVIMWVILHKLVIG